MGWPTLSSGSLDFKLIGKLEISEFTKKLQALPKSAAGNGSQHTEKAISDRANGDLKMKLKITITGPKVHDVGYRYHLLGLARSSKLKGFDAENQIADGQQQVEVLVEDSEVAVNKFADIIKTAKPPGAEVSDISLSDYDGEIMKLAEYSSWCTNIQLNKGIQAILGMAHTQLASIKILERMDNRLEENTKVLERMDSRQENIAKTNTQILSEIKGLRDDQPNPAIRQLQLDMAAVKARLNIP
jgi:acylphosphatase